MLKGIRLPAGAREVSYTETTSKTSSSPFPFTGQSNHRMISVEFNYSGDWPSVVAHFENCMRNSGINFQNALAGMGGGSAGDMMGDMESWSRYYSDPQNTFSLMLMDNKAMMGEYGQSGLGGGLYGQGDYSLMIMKF